MTYPSNHNKWAWRAMIVAIVLYAIAWIGCAIYVVTEVAQ